MANPVTRLLAKIRKLREERRQLREQVARLEQENKQLREQLPPIITPPPATPEEPPEPTEAVPDVPEPPTRPPQPGGPPRRAPRRVAGRSYATYFRAYGGSRTGGIVEDDPAGLYSVSAEMPPPGYDTGPGAFYSQSSLGGLGQVRFEGQVPLERLIQDLNESLGVVDDRGRLVDFRTVYPIWSYKYRIVEFINGTNPLDIVCVEDSHDVEGPKSCLEG